MVKNCASEVGMYYLESLNSGHVLNYQRLSNLTNGFGLLLAIIGKLSGSTDWPKFEKGFVGHHSLERSFFRSLL